MYQLPHKKSGCDIEIEFVIFLIPEKKFGEKNLKYFKHVKQFFQNLSFLEGFHVQSESFHILPVLGFQLQSIYWQ